MRTSRTSSDSIVRENHISSSMHLHLHSLSQVNGGRFYYWLAARALPFSSLVVILGIMYMRSYNQSLYTLPFSCSWSPNNRERVLD